MALSLKVKVTDDIRVIHCSGRVDSDGYRELKETVDRLIYRGKCMIILDFTDVDFIISSGWGVITSNLAEIKQSSGDIIVCGMNDKVRDIYEKVELDKLIKSYQSLSGAIEHFKTTEQDG